MNQNKDFYHKIEAYLCDGLPPAEKKALEKAIAADPQLKKQVEMQRLEWDAMELLLETDLRDKMEDWDAEMPFEWTHTAMAPPTIAPTEPKTVRMPNYYRWSLAASLVLAVGALIWLWQPKPSAEEAPIVQVEPPKSVKLPVEPPETPKLPIDSPKTVPVSPTTAHVTPKTVPESPKKQPVPSPKPIETVPPIVQVTPVEPVISPPAPVPNPENYAVIAETNYKKEPFKVIESSTRGRGVTETLSPEEKAEEAYEKADFKQVVSLLNATPLEKTYISQLNLLAHAYFQQKQFANALPLLEKMVDWNRSRLVARQEAEWYLLLGYLAQCPQYQTQFDALAQQIKGNAAHESHAKVIALLETLKQK
ncbi:MAG: hypothetical protein RLZZ628_2205 [Bacteroidota bacterium]|jgi:hypothetical protein